MTDGWRIFIFRPLIWALALILMVTFWPRCSMGAEEIVFTRDSVIFDATDIIEGHILGPRKGEPEWVGDNVKVTAVYQGDLKPGDVCIVGGLWSYGKQLWGESGKGNELGAGDDVLLYLRRDSNPAMKPYESNVLGPLPQGVRWIFGNKVISFGQWGNPGPTVAFIPERIYSTKTVFVACVSLLGSFFFSLGLAAVLYRLKLRVWILGILALFGGPALAFLCGPALERFGFWLAMILS